MPNNKELILAAEDLLRSTASYSGAEIEVARSKLKRQIQTLTEQARGGALGSERYAKITHTTQRYVNEHTWQSVAVIALLGIAVGAYLYGNNYAQRLSRRQKPFGQRLIEQLHIPRRP